MGSYLCSGKHARAGLSTSGGIPGEWNKGGNHLSLPAGHATFDAAQDTVNLKTVRDG